MKLKKLAAQDVNLSKSHVPYDHHLRVSPTNNAFIRDFNIVKNPVNSPVYLKNISPNQQHESITKNKLLNSKRQETHKFDATLHTK